MKGRIHGKGIAVIIVAASIVAAIVLYLYSFYSVRTPLSNAIDGQNHNEPYSVSEQAKELAQTMTPEQKVGQLMMIGIQGTDIDEESSYILTQYHVGNVILFDRNMQSPQQVKGLNEKLTKIVTKQSGIEPFLAIDQEGGYVLRMRNAFPRVPSEQEIGESGDPEKARYWAAETGQELKKLGFNVNFAPVVDVDSSSERSYSTDADTVTAFADAAVSGYEENQIWCALKHFPGIGSVKTDPHIEGDTVMADAEMLRQRDVKPFAQLIQKHDGKDMFIMVSNVTFPAYDAALPACVSPAVMTDLLRHELGYTGLVFSDDMEMGAMANHYAFTDMGVMAIKAGADIVLVCHDYGHEKETYAGLLNAYKHDYAFRKLVDEKVEHILETKLAR